MGYKPTSQETACPQKTKDAVKSALCCHCSLFPVVLFVITPTLSKSTRGEGEHQDGSDAWLHLTGPSSAGLEQPARSLQFQQLLDGGTSHGDGADCGAGGGAGGS